MARRSRDEWRELVGEQARSGLSVSEFCRREGLTENSFYRWRRLVGQVGGATFVPLEIVSTRTVEVELPCGATVKVAADQASLREVFAALLSVGAGDA